MIFSRVYNNHFNKISIIMRWMKNMFCVFEHLTLRQYILNDLKTVKTQFFEVLYAALLVRCIGNLKIL